MILARALAHSGVIFPNNPQTGTGTLTQRHACLLGAASPRVESGPVFGFGGRRLSDGAIRKVWGVCLDRISCPQTVSAAKGERPQRRVPQCVGRLLSYPSQ